MNFSVIIPVYNCRALLEACVESILNAALSSLEILLIDDGSTDGSQTLCDTLQQRYPQIRVLRQAHTGVSAARNAGLHMAAGKWILFADADDTLDSELLKLTLSEKLQPSADLTVFGLSYDYYHHGHLYRRDICATSDIKALSGNTLGASLYPLYQHNLLCPVWNKVYRRSIILENKLCFNTEMYLYEDLEFVLQYLRFCSDIRILHDPVYHYRQSEDEANAKRRLRSAASIPDLLLPVGRALDCLLAQVSKAELQSRDHILQHLHLTLAREKTAISDSSGIRRICRNYADWESSAIASPISSKLRDDLINNHVLSLLFKSRLSVLRHRIAVLVKYCLYRLRHGEK